MTHRPHRRRPLAAMAAVAMMALTACSSIDCPLNNVVYTRYALAGRVDTLADTLTIATVTSHGDSVLINRMVDATQFSLPISYTADVDELHFAVGDLRDTVWVEKTNTPHFVSVDCGMNYFHTLTAVRSTHNSIDSVSISHKEVTYDTSQDHILIYFRSYRY